MVEPQREDGLSAALRRFPDHAVQIRRMVERDDDFRSICEDLSDAEKALRSVDQLPGNLRDGRRAEFEQLAESLAEEIERCLNETKIIRLPRRPSPQR